MILSMGDEWEDDRLARRESFILAHRITISDVDSMKILNLREGADLLMNQLLHYTAEFRATLSQLIALIELSNEQTKTETLRATYSRLSRKPCINLERLERQADELPLGLDSNLAVTSAFGVIVANMMGINRCIISFNEIRNSLAQIESRVHGLAVAAMKGFSSEFEKKTIEVETPGGQLLRIQPPTPLKNLKQISMDSVIADLRHWGAA